MTPLEELTRIISRWTRWYRVHQAVRWLVPGFLFGTAMALGLMIVLVLGGRVVEREFWWLTSGMVLAGTLGASLWGALQPLPPRKAAQRFDLLFGLRERTSTALELAAEADSTSPTFLLPQLRDALTHARRIQPRKALPLTFAWREFALGLILFGGSVLLWNYGTPYFQQAQQTRAIQQAIELEQQAIEDLIETIETNPDLTEEQQNALTEALETATEQLEQTNDLEESITILQETGKQLEALANAEQAQELSQSLQEAGTQLQQNDGSALENFGNDLANGDIISAANELQNLDLNSLTEAEQADLADQLEQAAETLAEGNPELSEQLAQAAEALQNGNAEAAQQALNQASQTLNQTGQQIAQAQAAQQAQTQLAEGQENLAQAGQNPGQQIAQGQNAQQGQNGQGQGQQGGENGGEGQNGQNGGTQSEGQGQGSGAGQGSGTSEGNGSQTGNTPIDGNNNPDGTGETTYEPIYAPQLLGGEGGDDVQLDGSGNPGETVLGQGNAAPGEGGTSSVPYVDVFPEYESAAREAIESGRVPPHLRDLVRKYFTNLEP